MVRVRTCTYAWVKKKNFFLIKSKKISEKNPNRQSTINNLQSTNIKKGRRFLNFFITRMNMVQMIVLPPCSIIPLKYYLCTLITHFLYLFLEYITLICRVLKMTKIVKTFVSFLYDCSNWFVKYLKWLRLLRLSYHFYMIVYRVLKMTKIVKAFVSLLYDCLYWFIEYLKWLRLQRVLYHFYNVVYIDL